MQITEMKAKVNTMDDIKKFVAYLNQFPNDVDVSSAQYVVDGKESRYRFGRQAERDDRFRKGTGAHTGMRGYAE